MYWTAGDDRAESWQYQYRKADESYPSQWSTVSQPWPENRSQTVGGLENGVQYYFRVRGILTSGNDPDDPNYVDAEGDESHEVAGTPNDFTIREAPDNLRAHADYGEVTLTWDRVEKATDYELSWSKDNYHSGWYSIGNVTRYTVRGLSSMPHTFWIRGVNNSSYGPASEVSATPLPAAPGNLTATAGDKQVTLTWNEVAGANIRYQYQQKTDGDYGDWKNAGAAANHTVTGLENGGTCTFRVRALNGSLQGAPSGEASAIPSGSSDGGGEPQPQSASCDGDGLAICNLLGVSNTYQKVTVSWDATPGATYYEYEHVRQEGPITCQIWWTTVTPGSESKKPASRFTPAMPSPSACAR